MFEGLVRQLLLGYLGRYIKDIQRDQLKITVWNEEVLLENVELILEAFDYLQFPFALKQGRVGRLSIRIPWKKLGREPIIIMIDDVFILASQRNEGEWSWDAVERREFAGKKAKLAAAELAKLSRCMGDNQTGNLFMSYIAAKVLDSIQVSVGSFHLVYCDVQPDSAQVMFGLKFSSLTITKQNMARSFTGKVRAGQVIKLIEIEALGIYCNAYEGEVDSNSINREESSTLWCNPRFQSNKFDYLLNPFNVSVTLLVNRSGESSEELPQYSLGAELSSLAMTLNEVQLRQVFILLDYLQISRLREKYGRYRPWRGSLSCKPDGWQKHWWCYAQESVLSDVRKKLKKTSWRYLGERLNKRHNYIKLYKTKLDFLRREQPIGESILSQLEEMEREMDIDDILSYRSLAEQNMQEAFSELNSTAGTDGGNYIDENPREDDRSSSRSRRWLNWLSRGMLGAGGTDDSSHFSGVVSDEVVKDIYEATKFHPRVLQNTSAGESGFKSGISLRIQEISVALQSIYSCQEIAKIYLMGGVLECKLSDALASIVLDVNSGRVLYPRNGKEILKIVTVCQGGSEIENESSCRAKVDIFSSNDVKLSVKVIKPLEVTYDENFVQALFKYVAMSKSLKLQHERVLSSLNSFEDVPTRLLTKAKYILSSRCRINWDVSIVKPILNFPYQTADLKEFSMVFQLGSLCFTSKRDIDSSNSSTGEQLYNAESFLSSTESYKFDRIRLESLYNYFVVQLIDLEVKLTRNHASPVVLLLEKSCVSINLACCVITDESYLKQLEVNANLSVVNVHFSLLIHESIVAVTRLLDVLNSGSDNSVSRSSQSSILNVRVGLLRFHVDLANEKEYGPNLISSSEELDIRFSFTESEECWISTKGLEITFFPLKRGSDNLILCSLRNPCNTSFPCQKEISEQSTDQSAKFASRATFEAMLQFHYKVCRNINVVYHEYTINSRDADLHCHPYVVGVLAGFFDKISSYHTPPQKNSFRDNGITSSPGTMQYFEFQRFGFSKFFESIPFERFPFVTIYNSGYLGSLESSLDCSNPDYRKLFKGKKYDTECSSTLETRRINTFASDSACGSDAVLLPEDIGGSGFYVFNMDFSGFKVHFHDSSCIVGTIILPKCNSSLMISENYMDMVCSAEDLVLTTSWCNKYLNQFLWGPSTSNSSSVLNVRVRKRKFEELPSSRLEVCVAIQHVRCILPSEYLVIIIGYFSLPEWNENPDLQTGSEIAADGNMDHGSPVTYKFEILDSILILPCESDNIQDLKVDMDQLYVSYIHKCDLRIMLDKIPSDCMIPEHKMAKRNHCLNIFGRGLSLSVLFHNDITHDGAFCEQSSGLETITFAAPVSADVWIRLPCDILSSASTCIMSRVGNCQLFIDDIYAFAGFETLLDIINHFSLIGDEAKLFKSDIHQFLKLKSHFKKGTAAEPLECVTSFTEVSCLVDSFVMKLSRHGKNAASLEQVATIDVAFACSVSLENESPKSMDVSFSSIVLYSMLNSVMLAKCEAACKGSPVLSGSLRRNNLCRHELHFTLPYVDIWMHYFDWTEFFGLYEAYSKSLQDEARFDLLSRESNDIAGSSETVAGNSYEGICNVSNTVSNQKLEKTQVEILSLAATSKNIGVTIHFPLSFDDRSFSEIAVTGFQEKVSPSDPSSSSAGNHWKYITVTSQIRSIDLSSIARNVKLNIVFGKMNGDISMFDGEDVKPWPLFHVSRASLEMEIQNAQDICLGIHSDGLEIYASHPVLSLFHAIVSYIVETTPSEHHIFGSLQVKVQMRELCLVISEGKWSCSGPLLEVFSRMFVLHANATENDIEGSIACDLEVQYYNICKVLWEPFIEPWSFEVRMIRKIETNVLLNRSAFTNIGIVSSAHLNVNITESLVECIFRTIEMVKDAWGLMGSDDVTETETQAKPHSSEDPRGEKYAPYILQNLTSLPLVYYVYQQLGSDVEPVMVDENSVQPGASVPIYPNHSPEELVFYRRQDLSSHRLSEKQSNRIIHHLMSIHIDGTSVASVPCSIDHVGLKYFEVDFSKASSYSMDIKENVQDTFVEGFMVPVVFEVSLQRHSKLIRVYSRVIILNATSMPLELRFDIPFGVSPEILDPVHPGQEFPLPLHLAEAGRMRWRPLGNSHLWSEARSISNVLSQESKIGFLRSFACYPVHPSSEPFRCCLSVQSTELPASGVTVPSSSYANNSLDRRHDHMQCGLTTNKRFVHQVTLSTPLVVYNYLPEPIMLKIESGGISSSVLLSEVEIPFHHVDPSHDLGLEFKMHAYGSSVLKFPRSEIFGAFAKLSGSKFSQIETLRFDPDLGGSPIYVAFEKTMHIVSGAREVFVFVPFLLYNCTESPLFISDCANSSKESWSMIPSAQAYVEQPPAQSQKDGLGILSSDEHLCNRDPNFVAFGSSPSDKSILLTRRNIGPQLEVFTGNNTFSNNSRNSSFLSDTRGNIKARIYSPCPISAAAEIMVRIRKGFPGSFVDSNSNLSWSAPFLLLPPSGSTSVLVPGSSSTAASIVSVTCCPLAEPFSGRTQGITFQPRYVITNSCSKDICYKQKGTNLVAHLGSGQHAHLQWTDTTRELLISICFNEPGWHWSGSFLPDHLGDTQVKMWNFVSGSSKIIRVEVQNTDILSQDEKLVGSFHGNAGTNLIHLSDDDTGYMPYRIDNFSKETLEVYQQRCETSRTIIHPYTSCPYAWDEPSYPHRLTIEVLGDHAVGSYALDDLKEPIPVHLRATSEKPERMLLLRACAEGATKVLSVIDSSYHILKDTNEQLTSKLWENGKKRQQDEVTCYTEEFSLIIPSIGISLINSQPQELLFACATNVSVGLLQSLEHQKFCLEISSLQVDNQLRATSYPVMLSFIREHKGTQPCQKYANSMSKPVRETVLQTTTDCQEPIIFLSAAKWRKKDLSLISVEYIIIRVAEFCLALELEHILHLLEFIKVVSLDSGSKVLPLSDPTLHPLVYDMGSLKDLTLKVDQPHARNIPVFNNSKEACASLPLEVPVGAPWKQIQLLARKHRKIYFELFELAPIKCTLSFSSAPWMLRNGVPGESLIHRGVMALAEVDGARIHLKQFTLTHQIASWESFQEILFAHYTRQLLHETYKVFGSAGVIGNPMGFARNVGLGIRDFLSAPVRSISKSPTGLIRGMAHGTTSLLSNTVYALSDAASQFSRAAHKGIVAFALDNSDDAILEKQQKRAGSRSKGVINEVLEGFTGLLQSPIKEAEKHGLPGIVSGVALGVAGLVARPTASILEVTGKTAQGIKKRSRFSNTRSQLFRVRLPRPLSRGLPLKPYSWEEAVGASVLTEAGDGLRFKDEVLVMCKALKQAGKFVVVTENLLLVVNCSSFMDIQRPGFQGIPADPDWLIETEIELAKVIHADARGETIGIVGCSSETIWKQKQQQPHKNTTAYTKSWSNPPSSSLPLFHCSLDLPSKSDAEDLLQVLLFTIEAVKRQGRGPGYLLHQCSIR